MKRREEGLSPVENDFEMSVDRINMIVWNVRNSNIVLKYIAKSQIVFYAYTYIKILLYREAYIFVRGSSAHAHTRCVYKIANHKQVRSNVLICEHVENCQHKIAYVFLSFRTPIHNDNQRWPPITGLS